MTDCTYALGPDGVDGFTIYSGGVADAPAVAIEKLVNILLDPKACRLNWATLGEVIWQLADCPYDRVFLVLALMANPVLRDEAWNAPDSDGGPLMSDDPLAAWLVFYEPENDSAAADYVRQVVREVVHDLYVEFGDEDEEAMP